MAKRVLTVDGSSVTRTITRWFAVDGSSVSHLIKRAFVIDSGGTARQILSDFALANIPTQSGSCSRVGAGNCTANTTVGGAHPDPTGGSGSFTYAWAYVSGVAATINFPTNSITNFTRTGAVGAPGSPAQYTGVYHCTVTDSVTGEILVSNNFNVTTTHTDST